MAQATVRERAAHSATTALATPERAKLAAPSLGRAGLVVILVSLAWTAAVFPGPELLLADSDHGYQLAAATQILAGARPFIDFGDTYGPLVFYASALGQWLTGGRVLGEFLLVLAGFAVGYALLFRLMLSCEVPRRIALGATIMAVALIPNSYRYYFLLGPMVFLSALWAYLAAPSWRRSLGLGLAITFAGLFRPDIGVFAALATAVGVTYRAPTWRTGLWRTAGAAGFALLGSAPWLLWLTAHDALARYFVNSSVDAIKMAVGMSLPIPDFDFSAGVATFNNAKAYLLRLPYVLAGCAAIALIAQWRTLGRERRAGVVAALVFTSLMLLQASHRTSWGHVRDVLPATLLLLAWAGRAGFRGGFAPLGSWGLAALVGTSLIGLARYQASDLTPAAVVRKVVAFSGTRAELLENIRRHSPDNPTLAMVDLIKARTPADGHVFTLYGLPNLNYFSERLFAGGQMAVYPGYFSSRDHLLALTANLRREGVALVVAPANATMDNRPERALEAFAPEICEFLDANFEELAVIGGLRVLVPRRLTPKPGLPLVVRPALSGVDDPVLRLQ